ncbi:hypothetical protein [Carnimonas bestiolae]|uniref:hypothetical protein n=1 Tax=Carnimonas bestiolae TaxID=3402172 RepID=UPI003EDCACBF
MEHEHIISVKNPRRNMNGTIDVDVKWTHSHDEYWPFTASPNDAEPHGREIYTCAVEGEFGEIADVSEEQRNAAAHQMRKQAVDVKLAELELEIQPLRDEALAGVISDSDKKVFARLVRQRKKLTDSM